jgi:hypothetical protein
MGAYVDTVMREDILVGQIVLCLSSMPGFEPKATSGMRFAGSDDLGAGIGFLNIPK